MTRARLIELHRRRAQLTARAQAEREQLVDQLRRADAALAWIGRGRAALEEARRRPLLLATVAALLLLLRPKRAVKLLAGGWSLWRLFVRLRRLWTSIAPALQPRAGRGT
ncbi:MAG: hypothetical protein A3H34_07285 [Betaproteobacteria bacterium RIFCSPLOWO2_02_FULL_67_19]|nr:MAG: hypothetical protein A3H34_07285 [Betaproteobacteria bacterium RIFCSPLOWO2_02_FULL_67_19]